MENDSFLEWKQEAKRRFMANGAMLILDNSNAFSSEKQKEVKDGNKKLKYFHETAEGKKASGIAKEKNMFRRFGKSSN